jgi:signal transduction histidine kinase
LVVQLLTRPWPAVPSRRTLLVLVLVSAALGIAVFQLASGFRSPWESALGVAVGWSFIASGLVGWERRPENRIGPTLALTGVARLGAEFCLGSPHPLLYTVGHLLHPLFMLGVAFVMLAFPDGRIYSRTGRRLLAAAVVPIFFLPLAWLLLGGPRYDGHDLLQVVYLPRVVGLLETLQMGSGALVAALLVPVVIRRWQRASEPLRLAMGPVMWVGSIGLAVMVLYLVDALLGTPLGGWAGVITDLFLAAVPLAFLAGLLRARLAHSAVADLIVELGGSTAPGELRQALARALHDPSLALAYRLSEGERYVDADGRTVKLPGPGDARSVTFARREGRTIAALVHDSALGNHPQLVESVCAAAALALENERLQADLKARLDELRESRSRIVEAAVAERRRIERNLHDGTQQRLVSISMALGLGEAKLPTDAPAAQSILGQARASLSAALEELRELSQGIHPGILTERGLAGALEELALSAAIPVEVEVAVTERLPETVETTAYYLVCEGLANVSKHARATTVAVRVGLDGGTVFVEVEDDGVGGAAPGEGSGLRGLTDRVEALGGKMSISSPPGQGTRVRAEIPCA